MPHSRITIFSLPPISLLFFPSFLASLFLLSWHLHHLSLSLSFCDCLCPHQLPSSGVSLSVFHSIQLRGRADGRENGKRGENLGLVELPLDVGQDGQQVCAWGRSNSGGGSGERPVMCARVMESFLRCEHPSGADLTRPGEVVGFTLIPVPRRLCWPPVGLSWGTDVSISPSVPGRTLQAYGPGQVPSAWSRTCSLPWPGRARSMCTSLMGSGARSSLQGMGAASDGVVGSSETLEQWAQALLAPEPLFHFLAPSSALYASRLYLSQYQLTHPERLAKHMPGGPRIRGTHPAPIPNLCPSAKPPSPLSCDSWSQIQRRSLSPTLPEPGVV